jgi:ankyrin repeat protein
MRSALISVVLLALALQAFGGEIQEAAAAGNLERVKQLVNGNPTLVNQRDRGTTPLHEAARAGHASVVRYLVDKGAMLNVNDIHGATPLRLAVGYRRTEVMEFLRGKGALERVAPAGSVARSATNKPPVQPQVATTIESPRIKPAASNAPFVGRTPLSANTNMASSVTNPQAVGSIGATNIPFTPKMLAVLFPIHEAARLGDIEQIKFLFKTDPELIEATDERGQTPLHVAAANGQFAVAQALVGLRAKVMVRTGNGQTPLHMAAKAGDVRTAELLVASGANVNARDAYEVTPLLSATLPAQREEFRPADLMSDKASAVQPAQKKAAAAKMHEDQLALVKLLVSKGADVNAANRTKTTALLQAVRLRNDAVVDVLLKSGANPNVIEEMGGATPLHIAAGRGLTNIAASLLNTRAAVNATDSRGETPLGYALHEGHLGMASLLKQRGANIGQQQALSSQQQSLLAAYHRTEAVLQKGSGPDRARAVLELTPTKSDVQKMFPKHADPAWAVVEQMREEIKQAFQKPLKDADQGKEIWRVRTESPSLIAEDWQKRGWLNRELPAYSLVVDRVGGMSRPGDYCFVNGRWILVPPLQTILTAQQLQAQQQFQRDGARRR